MTRLTGTSLFARLLRLLVVVGCVLPLSGPRAIAAASALTPLSAPVAPMSEEEESEREESVKEQADVRFNRRPDYPAPTADRHHHPHVHPHSIRATPSRAGPAFDDPFRNGLGSPYRC